MGGPEIGATHKRQNLKLGPRPNSFRSLWSLDDKALRLIHKSTVTSFYFECLSHPIVVNSPPPGVQSITIIVGICLRAYFKNPNFNKFVVMCFMHIIIIINLLRIWLLAMARSFSGDDVNVLDWEATCSQDLVICQNVMYIWRCVTSFEDI